MEKQLLVSEIFYSLQGEGFRAGQPTTFIRLQGCKAKGACYAAGIRCDTEFESGKEANVADLIEFAKLTGCPWVTWTGGEPLDQLTTDIVEAFREAGFKQSIETSGLHALPEGMVLDWVVVSPKVAEHVIAKNFPDGVDELRYVRHKGQEIPRPSVKAKYKCISPHSDGFTINHENVQHCVRLCMENPSWHLSVQQHKQWQVL